MANLFITLAPPLLMLLYFIRSDKFPEPSKYIYSCVFIGALITLPAGILNEYFIDLLTYETGIENSSFVAGLVEESLKLLAFMFFISRLDHFNEPIDAIVYGVCISLGFAAYENLIYVYVVFPEENIIALVRAFTAIPLHCACGIIMGIYLSEHHFGEQNCILKALLVPVVIHASYNYFAGSLMMMIILVFALIFGLREWKKLKKLQAEKSDEYEEKVR